MVVSLSDEEISRLYRVRKPVMQMLKNRGYRVCDMEINMSQQDFINLFPQNLRREDFDIHTAKLDNPADQICVFFPEEAKIGAETLKAYVRRLYSENVLKAILVVQDKPTIFEGFSSHKEKEKPTAFVQITCTNEGSSESRLEIFLEAQLMMFYDNLVPQDHAITDTQNKT
ncbi:DNA-directed RNA polymerases II and IV subunit 5A, partial [Mucuna pruriens]